MKRYPKKSVLMTTAKVALVIVTAITSAGCFEILEIDQPDTARPGQSITVTMEVRTDGPDDNAHHGIVAIKLPIDWEVEEVRMRGDYGRATFEFLPPGTADGDPGNQLDYWTRALERIWEPGDAMKWVVYQTRRPYKAPQIAFVDLFFDFVVGETTGTFELDYLVSAGAMDFSSPDLYALRQGNTITIE